jgi:hypothetical protein
MAKKWIYFWFALPALAFALHYGPGRDWLRRADAAWLVRSAEWHGKLGDWERASERYVAALATLPIDAVVERQKLEVCLGRALVQRGNLVEGQDRLEKTLAELIQTNQGDAAVARDARYELATASYYAAWIMRLEGATAEEWKPEAEAARQHFRLLAETTKDLPVTGGSNAFERSVEATVRLEQMDLSDLRAKSLPKNCPNCKNGLCQKKRKQAAGRCKAPGKKEGKGEEKQDARQEVKKNNGAGLHSGERVGS